MSTIHALMDHQLVPQLDPTAVDGFGYSWNMFYGPLPTYFIAGMFFICRNLALSINVVTLISIFLIGFIMYRYIKYRTHSHVASLLAAVLMITSNSVLVNIYQYSGYGPLFAIFFSILSLYGIQKILDSEKNVIGILMLSLGGVGMLLSHTLTCLIMILYIIIFLLFHFKLTLKRIKSFTLSACLSLGLSAYFLLPFIELKNTNIYNQFNQTFVNVYMWKSAAIMNSARVTLRKMLFPDKLNVIAFPILLIIISAVLLLTICLLYIFKYINKKVLGEIFIFLLLAISILIFCSHLLDWRKLPSFLWTMQYPTRIMFYASGMIFCIYIGLSFAYVAKKIPSGITNSVTILLVFISFIFSQIIIDTPNNFFRQRFDHLEKVDANYSISGRQFLKTAIGEFFPTNIGTQEKSLSQIISENHQAFYFSRNYIYPALVKRKQEGIINLSDKQVNVYQIKKEKYVRSEFKFVTKKIDQTINVELPKIYYPGYKAYSYTDGKKSNLQAYPSKRGYVKLTLPKGRSRVVTVYYGLSHATIIGLSLTIVSILISLYYLIKYRNGKR